MSSHFSCNDTESSKGDEKVPYFAVLRVCINMQMRSVQRIVDSDKRFVHLLNNYKNKYAQKIFKYDTMGCKTLSRYLWLFVLLKMLCYNSRFTLSADSVHKLFFPNTHKHILHYQHILEITLNVIMASQENTERIDIASI